MLSGQKFAYRTKGWPIQVIGYTIQPQATSGYEEFNKIITLFPPVTQRIKGFSQIGDPETYLINIANYNSDWENYPFKLGFSINNYKDYTSGSTSEGMQYRLGGFSDAGLTIPVNFIGPTPNPLSIDAPECEIDYSVAVSEIIEKPNLVEKSKQQWTYLHQPAADEMGGGNAFLFFPSYMFTGTGQKDFYLLLQTYTVDVDGNKVRNTIILNIRWTVI